MKTNETLTWYIKNWADSGKLGVCTSHLHLCNLTMNCSELPNFSYTHPLAFIPPISEQKLISSANEMVEQFEGNNEK